MKWIWQPYGFNFDGVFEAKSSNGLESWPPRSAKLIVEYGPLSPDRSANLDAIIETSKLPFDTIVRLMTIVFENRGSLELNRRFSKCSGGC
jgi:hypothetical protein